MAWTLAGLLLAAAATMWFRSQPTDMPPAAPGSQGVSPDDIRRRRQQAEQQQRSGQISAARATLENLVRSHPDDAICRRQLVNLLSDHGLHIEALTHLQTLLHQQQADFSDLVRLARNRDLPAGRLQLERAHQRQPDDPLPLIGLLHLANDRRDAAAVQTLLQQAESLPVPVPDELLRLQLQSELHTDAAAAPRDQTWQQLQLLYQNDPSHPETCLLTAEWARQTADRKLQQHSLQEALRRDPWNRAALSALASLLSVDDPVSADKFRQLEQTLGRIQTIVRRLAKNPNSTEDMQQIAQELTAIGRHAEATAWARQALRQNANLPWARAFVLQPADTTSWQHPVEALTADFHLPFTRLHEQPFADVRAESAAAEIRFEDVAADVGLRFQYDNGFEADQLGLKMHQWTGGGAAVVDIDQDSWPDLYLTQGGQQLDDAVSQSHPEKSSRQTDQLFRNRRGRQYDPITELAGIHETGFGQGVAAGDLDNDGFTDLYVANVGVNRVLINQGDGTFTASDVVRGDAAWTTSVAIADLNGDAAPDLFDVNYLSGPDVFTKTCDHDGYERICGPTDFPAAADRLLLSDGAGDFTTVHAALPETDDDRGMGLVIASVVSPGLQIYIANDEAANQLLVADTASDVSRHDIALTSGTAFDLYGQAQGSMGIATADVDGNGLLDLFVTNYYAEANTLYCQQQPGLFVDTTPPAQLSTPGFAMLGFGCQFLDLENDGDADLVVVNGHLDDFTFRGHPFHMLPQLFVNDGAGRFRSHVPDTPFFQTPRLGRSLARLDWNRDGRSDFVVSHLDSPVSLVTNRSVLRRPSTTLQLTGTTAARVPIGARTSIVDARPPQTQWLTAGDGYQCSNQQALQWPTDDRSARIHWPDGTVQDIAALPAGLHRIVQDRDPVYSIPE